MSKRNQRSCVLQILAVVKVAGAMAIAAAEALDRYKMLSNHSRYAAFQIEGGPGYQHLNQACPGEEIVDMPPPTRSIALHYLYMAVHSLAAPWSPGRASVSIVSGGEIDLTQGSNADLLSCLQGKDDGVDSRLITAISHMNPLPIIAI